MYYILNLGTKIPAYNTVCYIRIYIYYSIYITVHMNRDKYLKLGHSNFIETFNTSDLK